MMVCVLCGLLWMSRSSVYVNTVRKGVNKLNDDDSSWAQRWCGGLARFFLSAFALIDYTLCVGNVILFFSLFTFHLCKFILVYCSQVYDDKKLATHYMRSRNFMFDLAALVPLDLLQLRLGTHPLLRFPRFCKVSGHYMSQYSSHSTNLIY